MLNCSSTSKFSIGFSATDILLDFSLGWWPVAFETLDPFKGLNSKTAKVLILLPSESGYRV